MTVAYGFNNAEVQPTTQATVLKVAQAKLQTDLGSLINQNSIFVSDTPWPGVEISDNLFCTVCPASAGFDDEMFDGAADLGVVERSMIQVTVWSRIMTDRLERTDRALLDNDRGLLQLKRLVLKSLAGQMLYQDYPANTIQILLQYMKPRQAMHPPLRESEEDWASFSLAFLAPFNWDLTN